MRNGIQAGPLKSFKTYFWSEILLITVKALGVRGCLGDRGVGVGGVAGNKSSINSILTVELSC